MGSNYIATDATINPTVNCIHDSTIGYSADFSKNGEVDGWEYFTGVHTYGAWGGFLFGTILPDQRHGEESTIGRYNVFASVDANVYYFVRVVMKYNPWPRDERGNHPLPTQAKLRWRTLQDTTWDEDKEIYFDIEADNDWHTYIINVGVAQFWQGDVNDLRVWPSIDYGVDGDEFFIRAIDIFATGSFACKNTVCEKYTEYSNPCPWIGQRATIESASHEDDKLFNIDYGEELIININDYGNEVVKMKEVKNGNGRETANVISRAISRTNIGGYAEVRVDYTENDNSFKIHSGTIHEDSSVVVLDNDLTKYLKFFASNGVDISTYVAGETPVDGYSPLSSFKIKTHQALGLLDNSEKTQLTFNPFQYSVEGGRRDWLSSGTGMSSIAIGENDGDVGGQPIRTYYVIDNKNKTIVDYNHPFNASGRIKKIWLQATLDEPDYVKSEQEIVGSESRKSQELSGAKVMIVRPKRNGQLQVIYEWSVTDRDIERSYDSELYSLTQEGLNLDVDVFVNKGDMIAAWNIHMYAGRSISGIEYDAQFFQVDFNPEMGESFNPAELHGDGSGGILVYAHGEEPQQRLFLEIDLGHRYNIDKVDVKGEALNSILEYNVASCLDINWECDLFGGKHWTTHRNATSDGWRHWYERANTYYGLDRLNDNQTTVPDGLACDSFTLTGDGPYGWDEQIGSDVYTYNAGPGVTPNNPYYFWVNGDEEWLAVWLHATGEHRSQSVLEFDYDPMAIYLHFPYEKEKTIYKSKIYYKEQYNIRSFSLSTYGGYYYTLGDADDSSYDLIPEYTLIALDNVDYYEGSPTYDMVADYLFHNPCTGHLVSSPTSAVTYEWDPVYSDVIQDFSAPGGYGNDTGFFTHQSFVVDNVDAWQTARRTDWQIIEHQWEPITCKGWRLHTDFHKSTKITEMELYCVAEDVGSNLSGGVIVTFSDYKEVWWPTESVQKTTGDVEVFIGDSPRYLTVELIPVTETRYDDVVVYVKTEDVYSGPKGCEYIIYSDDAKTGVTNEAQTMEVKNVYGVPYDLYIDISQGKLSEEGLIFYSPLNDPDSVKNPTIGADSNYHKLDNYPLVNQDYNCAINCHTFGLHNLIDGAMAYYSYDDMSNWPEWGELSHGVSIGFENLPDSSRTVVVLPHLSRSRWWKFGLTEPDVTLNVREMRVYDNLGNLLDPEFYHDLDKTFEEGDVSERAPHLENISVAGSYYTLAGNQYITMDLGSQKTLGKIELWNDGRSDYVNFERTIDPYAGIDKYTRMCVRSWKDNTGSYLQDVSYYEHEVTMHGSTYVDSAPSNVQLFKDFGCLTDYTEWNTANLNNSTFDFVPTSGTVTSGSCEYPGHVDFYLECSNNYWDRFKVNLREDSGTQAWKMWQHLPFEITFAINIDGYVEGTHSTYKYPGMCVGLFGSKQAQLGIGYHEGFVGPQMYFDPARERFGILVRRNQAVNSLGTCSNNSAYRDVIYTTGLALNTDYYCKLTCYGLATHRDTDDVTYRAEVWTDAIDGSNEIVDLTLNTSQYWEAYEVGIGSCALNPGDNIDPRNTTPGTISGTIYDLKFDVDADIQPHPFDESQMAENEKAGIRIPAGSNNYVKIKNSPELDVRHRLHTHDLWVKFNTLPDVGQRWTIMEQYDYDTFDVTKHGWRLALYNTGTWYRWEWWVNEGADNGYDWSLKEYNGNANDTWVPHFNIVKDKWYFMLFSTGKQFTDPGFERYSFFDMSGRAVYDHGRQWTDMYDMPARTDIFLGKDFDGWICEPRISRGYNDLSRDGGGHRYATAGAGAYGNLTDGAQWQTPVRPHSRMYPFSFYVSDNNVSYGHYVNVDAQFPVDNSTYLPYLYYDGDNEFAEKYNSYFAIDLGHRYDIDIVRRYGATNDHLIDKEANVIYSSVDTDDPYEAFMTEPDYDTDDAFYGFGGEFIDKDRWRIDDYMVGNETKYLSMKNGRLEHRADSDLTVVKFYSNFGMRGDFDIQIKLGRISAPNSNNWFAQFRVDLSNEVKSSYNADSDPTYVRGILQYSNGYQMRYQFMDGGTDTVTYETVTGDDHGIRIIRDDYNFAIQRFDGSSWIEGDDRPVWDSRGKDVYQVQIILSTFTNEPTTRIYWKDFEINYADREVKRSHAHDARWMAIEMLNGDGTSRYLKKLGMYPDITNYNSPDNDNYNSSWTDLGPSVTSYQTGTNVALGKPVTSSSYIGTNIPERTTDGIIDNERSHAWLSNNDSEQWLLVDLGEEKEIYRVIVNHGYSIYDDDFLITDYRIESSDDGESFTTRWTINNNDSFERTHDVADPFTAKYIRMYITAYRANNTLYIKELDGIDYYAWEGTSIREIEIYESYGYSYVSSEEWPIVAINLKDQFYIQGHDLTGLFTEDNNYDWDNADSNWAWSDDIEQDPKKVSFSEFGATSNYEQWAIVKRDTATYHNVDPAADPEDQAYGIDYLKHAIVKSETKENPTNYPWWWSSILSTLSRDYSLPVALSTSSLKIEYPASSSLDTVQFIEGSNWGTDSDFAFRDGLGIRWYIEDIDKLDLTAGYVFFGGLDGTEVAQPVEYRWFMETISGSLDTGWNALFFRTKDADEVIYNESYNPFSEIRPEIPEYTQWQTLGLTFRGKDEAFFMNLDGSQIARNHFFDSSKFDYGLYLSGPDYLECPISEIDLKACTIEFWMRSDYTFAGLDIYRRFKNRSLFHLSNVANDIFGFMINSEGFNIYYGNLATDTRALVVTGGLIGAVDRLFHVAVSVSSNGKNMDGGASIRLYINGGLMATNHDTWSYSDEKYFKFTVGGKTPLALIEHSSSLETTSVDSVISNLRVYDYCKSDFTDSMNNTFSENGVDLVQPSKMVEISQDNVTFYKVGDAELPFFYDKVPVGDTVQVYVRSLIPEDLTGHESRTAGILTSWDIGV